MMRHDSNALLWACRVRWRAGWAFSVRMQQRHCMYMGWTHDDAQRCERPAVCLQSAMEGWAGFTNDMQRYYGVRMDCLNDAFHEEQKQYYHQTSAWADVSPQQLAGRPWCFKQYDLLKVTPQEIVDSFKVQLSDLPVACKRCRPQHDMDEALLRLKHLRLAYLDSCSLDRCICS